MTSKSYIASKSYKSFNSANHSKKLAAFDLFNWLEKFLSFTAKTAINTLLSSSPLVLAAVVASVAALAMAIAIPTRDQIRPEQQLEGAYSSSVSSCY